MEKKKRKRRLTEKQEKLVKARIKNPNATLESIGIQAEYKKKTARQCAHRALKSKNVQETLREAMERDPALCRVARLTKLKEGLDATKAQYFAHQGQVVDERIDIDFSTRKQYLELADKLCGDLTDRQEIKFDGPMPFKMVYSDDGDSPAQIPKPGDPSKP